MSEPTQSQLIRDTEIIKTILEEHFDRTFKYKADETAKIPNAVLYVVKLKTGTPNGKEILNTSELAEHFHRKNQTIREMSKTDARKRADPFPFIPRNRLGAILDEGDDWLLRQGKRPSKLTATESKKLFEERMKDSEFEHEPCEHEPKHLKGLCLACYKDDLLETAEAGMRAMQQARRANLKTASTKNGREAIAYWGGIHNGRRYIRIEFVQASEFRRARELGQGLDHRFDRAFDIVVTIENGNTVLTIRNGDREQMWMTVGDVAAVLTERLGRPVTWKSVEDLLKGHRKLVLPSHKGNGKMRLIWRPEFEEWYETWCLYGRRGALGKKRRKPSKQVN